MGNTRGAARRLEMRTTRRKLEIVTGTETAMVEIRRRSGIVRATRRKNVTESMNGKRTLIGGITTRRTTAKRRIADEIVRRTDPRLGLVARLATRIGLLATSRPSVHQGCVLPFRAPLAVLTALLPFSPF
jgi:hypothetical protein